MDPITIRPADADDLPGILALHAGLESDSRTLDLPHASAIFERILSYPNYRVYVAISEGTVVGTFALLIMDNLAHLGAPSAIVEDVVVSPAERGRGIGRQMMRHAMEHCERAGCYKMMLSSNLAREQAHQFYESLGFERHGYSFLVRFRKGG
jgi:ribosomal protein S18 acetylase RimI-like enzyme